MSGMLVLGRRRDEKIIIADDIVLTVVSIRPDKVNLGIAAPDHVRIDREEIRQRRLAENAPPREQVGAYCYATRKRDGAECILWVYERPDGHVGVSCARTHGPLCAADFEIGGPVPRRPE